MILVVNIRYRLASSIYYQPTQCEMSKDLTDQQIIDECLIHLKSITTGPIANWYIDSLKNRKHAKPVKHNIDTSDQSGDQYSETAD